MILPLQGNGFAVSGQLKISGGSLASADLDRVKLSDRDDFSVRVRHGSDGYRVKVAGSSIDLRSLMQSAKGDGKSAEKAAKGSPVSLQAKVDTAYGFNKEQLNGLDLSYSGRGSSINSFDIKAVTASGEALVAKATPDAGGTDVTVSCGDAAALARFADIYCEAGGRPAERPAPEGAEVALSGHHRPPQFLRQGREPAELDHQRAPGKLRTQPARDGQQAARSFRRPVPARLCACRAWQRLPAGLRRHPARRADRLDLPGHRL